MRLPDFEAWAIFATVVEQRSFSGAAEAIGLSKATVSKAVSRLETQLGTSLFHRTSRRLTLTESGKALADHARRIVAEGVAAEEAARDSATLPAGLVRVAAPMTFGMAYLAPAIAEFLAAHPDIEIDLNLSDARVDIVAEGFDIALRIADLPDSSLRARRLCGIAVYVVAAPSYLARHGRPTHPAQLAEHECIGYTNAPGATWRFTGPDGEEAAVRPTGRLTSNSGDAMLPALRAGLGIARLPDFIVDADIAAGTLEAILPDWRPPPIALHLMTPPSPLRPARVEALIDFLAARFRDSAPRAA
ncbi:LysR family transcriptional regulator [Hephaestia sp. GCM10023244]|uniref:LysR family transcriptional regulator n=1 Tax=unclassified Hephaestia TaxID=2631281 RepID=UPI0020770A99|nr:LysR family transcriptional regulator [Hephaestia sp. MAHUQ-44]MCM8731750.1 LysR family transcriptional regulator [Hephaestia sp. MAHUQ-44]